MKIDIRGPNLEDELKNRLREKILSSDTLLLREKIDQGGNCKKGDVKVSISHVRPKDLILILVESQVKKPARDDPEQLLDGVRLRQEMIANELLDIVGDEMRECSIECVIIDGTIAVRMDQF